MNKKNVVCSERCSQNHVCDCTMGNADDNSYENNNETVKYSVQRMK